MSEPTKLDKLVENLNIEADQCLNDGVEDLADLLAEASTEITALRAKITKARESLEEARLHSSLQEMFRCQRAALKALK